MLGPSLEDVRQKMQLMPTPMLMQYKSNPGQQQAGGIPMDMLAGLELSRRAQLQQQQQAGQAEPNIPTIVDAAAQQLGLGSLVPQGQPQGQPMPPPQMAAAPQPQQRPPMPPPQMAAAPQPQGQPQRFAKGGAIAFAAGETVPYTDVQSEQSMIRQLEEARVNALAQGDQSAVAAIDARIANLSGGRYSPPVSEGPTGQQAPRTAQDIFNLATTVGPQSKAYQEALAAHRNYLTNRQPAGLSEADRNRMIEEQFQKNQAASRPYYDKQEGLLSEERKAAVNTNLGADAWMRFGLGMMGGRGSLASIMSQAGLGALDYYEKAKQAEAAALRESRKGEMALLRSRMADERGDRTAAQAFADRADQAAIRQQKYEDDAKEALLQVQGKSAGIEASQQKNTVDEMARMLTAEENRNAANRRAAEALQERRDRYAIARETAPRKTDLENRISILAGPHLRAGVPPDIAREKALAEIYQNQNAASMQRNAIAAERLVRDNLHADRAYHNIKDPAAKEAYVRDKIEKTRRSLAEAYRTDGGSESAAPASAGVKFLGFE